MKRIHLGGLIPALCIAFAIFAGFSAMAQPPRDRDGGPDRRGGPPPRFELGQVFPPPLMDELDLTAEQQKELDAIQKDLRGRLEKLLTDNQKRTIENFRPRGSGGPGPRDGGGPPRDQQRGNERRDRQPAENRPPKDAERPAKELPTGVTRVPVTFSGGHDTDPQDHGRPVVLIAAGLGVTSDVFRDAFSKVRPARAGTEPEPAQVRQNKSVLLAALGKYGITNDELDRVSDYYRYAPGRNSLWTHKSAVANALVKDGKVIGYEIVSGGSGYSSTPTLSLANLKAPAPKIELAFGKTLESNGSVSSITIAKADE